MNKETLEEAKNICIQTGLPCGMQCLSEDACDRTLEEAVNNFKKTDVYINEIKQVQERSYSEEEVFNICRKFAIFVLNKRPSYKKQLEWFEEFKKK